MLAYIQENPFSRRRSRAVRNTLNPIEFEKSPVKPRTKLYSFEREVNFCRSLVDEKEGERDDSFEDGRVTKLFHSRMLTIEGACLVMSLFGLILIVIQYELEFYEMNSFWSDVILYMIFGLSLTLVFLIIIRSHLEIIYLKKRKLIPHTGNLFNTGGYIPMLFEIFITMIIPYPWLTENRTFSHSLVDGSEIYYHDNEILSLFSVLRVIIILRVLLLSSYWNSNRAQRLCEMYAVEAGMLFTAKCVMKKKPLVFIFAAFLASIPFFGWMLRVAERPIFRNFKGELGYNWANSLWNIIITMTTVGYGDYYPQTFLGRFVVFFVCIWGTMVISLMVITLMNIFTMNNLESKAFTVLSRLTAKDVLRKEAANVITNLARGKFLTKKTGRVSQLHIEQTKKYLKSFKNALRTYRELSTENATIDDIMQSIEFLRDEVISIKETQVRFMESMQDSMSGLGFRLRPPRQKTRIRTRGSTMRKSGKATLLLNSGGETPFMRLDPRSRNGSQAIKIDFSKIGNESPFARAANQGLKSGNDSINDEAEAVRRKDNNLFMSIRVSHDNSKLL